MNKNSINLTTHCLFCDPKALDQEDQILLRSNNFYLFAGLGPIVPGYIIIAPYSCEKFKSFADIPPELNDEVMLLRALITDFYQHQHAKHKDFNKTHPKDKRYEFEHAGMHFEHGRTGVCLNDGKDTKHCYHAHLCCYPNSFPIWEEMKRDGLKVKEIAGFCGLNEEAQDSAYLFVQNVIVNPDVDPSNALREKWDTHIAILKDESQIPGQYMRRLLANRIRQKHLWNWESYPRWNLVNELIDDFEEWLSDEKNYKSKYKISVDKDEKYRIHFVESVNQTNEIGNDQVAGKFFEEWHGSEQHHAVRRFLKHLPEPAVKDAKAGYRPKVLDAGCGPGFYLKLFYILGLDCTGIDISEEMLAKARQILELTQKNNDPKNRLPTPKLEKKDAFNLEFKDGEFDGVWYSAILVHAPKMKAKEIISSLYRILKEGGVLYLSAQTGGDARMRWEGRIFFYYSDEELKRWFGEAGFILLDEWDDITDRGSCGHTKIKTWRHYILKKPKDQKRDIQVLSDLGESGVLEVIKKILPENKNENIVLGVGDDCAAIIPIPGELLVSTTDPCPTPVISMLGDHDLWYYGWFTMIINISDLGAMGAKPLGITLAIEAPEDMPVSGLERFYEGVLAASKEYNCPVIGGNVKDAPRFSCVGNALGSVHPDKMLRRDVAKPGEKIVVLGDMGRFWAGVIYKLRSLKLSTEESEILLQNLKQPKPRIKEGLALAELGISKCAMDSSDGLIGCFYEVARSGKNIDVNLDLTPVVPDPIVKKVADMVNIDVRKLMLAWGDWELVCTVEDHKLERLKEAMKAFNCPVSVVGTITEGNGEVWITDGAEKGRLNYIVSERFSKKSYFSHGLENYLHIMKTEPLYDIGR